MTEIYGKVEWPEGTGVIQVIVEPGLDASVIRERVALELRNIRGVIVEDVKHVGS